MLGLYCVKLPLSDCVTLRGDTTVSLQRDNSPSRSLAPLLVRGRTTRCTRWELAALLQDHTTLQDEPSLVESRREEQRFVGG